MNETDLMVNLVAGRHETVFKGEIITDAVWLEPLTSNQMHDHIGLESHALNWLSAVPESVSYVGLFVTGLTACTVAFLQAYVELSPDFGLSLLFYDRDSRTYSEMVWHND